MNIVQMGQLLQSLASAKAVAFSFVTPLATFYLETMERSVPKFVAQIRTASGSPGEVSSGEISVIIAKSCEFVR